MGLGLTENDSVPGYLLVLISEEDVIDSDLGDLIDKAVAKGLDRAEKAWSEVGRNFIKKHVTASSESIMESVQPSIIPGHPWVADGTPKVSEFVALVVDMRDSTGHLKTCINNPHIKEGFQRIFYETSALFPAISEVVNFGDGVITEYLGDGALALFKVEQGDSIERLKEVHGLAKNCVGEVRDIINEHLWERYELPALSLGAGISIGKAMVTLVGSDHGMQPRAIGQCVWEASKLSGGRNAVFLSESAKFIWPTAMRSSMRFIREKIKDVYGYELKRNTA